MKPDPLSEPLPRRRQHPHEFCGPAPLPAEPTDFPPLSWGKVLELARRVERGESLWHPGDAPMPEDGVPVHQVEEVRQRQRRQRSAGEIERRKRESGDPVIMAKEAARKKAWRRRRAAARATGQTVRPQARRRRKRGLLPPCEVGDLPPDGRSS